MAKHAEKDEPEVGTPPVEPPVEPSEAGETREKKEDVEMYRGGRLTYAGLKKVIEGGGSVIVDGTHYTRLADLPPEEECVKNDAQASEAMLRGIDAQMARLAATRASLERSGSGEQEAPGSSRPMGSDAIREQEATRQYEAAAAVDRAETEARARHAEEAAKAQASQAKPGAQRR